MSHWSGSKSCFSSGVHVSLLILAIGCSDANSGRYRPASTGSSAPATASDENPTATESVANSSSTTVPVITSSEKVKAQPDTQSDSSLVSPSSVTEKGSGAVVNADVPGTQLQTSDPPKFEVLIKEKKFRTDRKTGALSVSYDDLDLEKVLNMKEVTANVKDLMPDWLKGLSGKKIRIRGFMKPQFVAEGIERFVLARDTQACCFGPNPKIDYLIDVKMKQDTTTNYIPESRAFDVVGTFKIEPEGDGGKLFGLYVIENAEVIDR